MPDEVKILSVGWHITSKTSTLTQLEGIQVVLNLSISPDK